VPYPAIKKGTHNMNIITTTEALSEMVSHYLTQDAFAFDVETVGPQRGLTPVNEVLWITFATHGRCDVIPMGHPNGEFIEEVFPLTGQGEIRKQEGLALRLSDYSRDSKKATKIFGPAPDQLFPNEVFSALEPLLFDDSKLTIGHNLIFDLTSIAKYYKGRVPEPAYFDTMVASFIVDNRNKNKCGLDDCLKREFNYEMVKGVGKEVEKYSFEEVAKYAYLDAKYTFLLWKTLQPRLEAADLTKVFSLEMDVLRVLCDMKLTGAVIDVEALSSLHASLESDLDKTKASIWKAASREFNINSNQEKQHILYGPKDEGGRGLKPKILTPKGEDAAKAGKELLIEHYSVSAEALEPYRDKDALVTALLEYSDLNKLLTTYVTPYLGGDVVRTVSGKSKIEHKDSLLINGKLHCDFIQHGAETGRFSSRNPNLQNVPAPHTPNGKAIRNLFVAPEGHSLVVADYSQIEPRVIASFSEDPIMMKNYLEGGDIYTTVGDTMGVDRKAGKVLVLSMAYGVGPDKIAKSIGCSVAAARDLLNKFSERFKTVASYRSKVLGATRQGRPPYVTTITGRRRYLPEIFSKDPGVRAGAERQAFNTRIQGSAADIIKIAMVRAHTMLPKQAKITLTVHDELVVTTPDNLVDETVSKLREAMEGIHVLKVPLIADITVAKRWGDAK
jgi:DNA polymerase I-like protein with 3'-5' exonuclease and polymerase domains